MTPYGLPLGVNPQAWQRLQPRVRDFLRGVQRKTRPSMQHLPLDLAREAYAMGSSVLEPEPPSLKRIQNLRIFRRDGSSLRARLYAPQGPEQGMLPLLVFFHGGGFVMGSIDTHDAVCRTLCHTSGCAVISVDYRLAPEHKFPAAFDDCWDAVHWLGCNAAAWGLDGSRMAVGGDSAGGTLGGGLCRAGRAAEPALAAAIAFLPWYAGRTGYTFTAALWQRVLARGRTNPVDVPSLCAQQRRFFRLAICTGVCRRRIGRGAPMAGSGRV